MTPHIKSSAFEITGISAAEIRAVARELLDYDPAQDDIYGAAALIIGALETARRYGEIFDGDERLP